MVRFSVVRALPVFVQGPVVVSPLAAGQEREQVAPVSAFQAVVVLLPAEQEQVRELALAEQAPEARPAVPAAVAREQGRVALELEFAGESPVPPVVAAAELLPDSESSVDLCFDFRQPLFVFTGSFA